MTEAEYLKATHRGTLEIGETSIPCAVLEDGTRVLSETGIAKAILKSRSGAAIRRKGDSDGGAPLPVFLASNSLKPFIPSDLLDGAPIIIYKSTGELSRGITQPYCRKSATFGLKHEKLEH